MPIQRFRTLEEAARALPRSPDPWTALRTALFLAGLSGATRPEVRTTEVGIRRFATIAEAESERQRLATARLRAHGA